MCLLTPVFVDESLVHRENRARASKNMERIFLFVFIVKNAVHYGDTEITKINNLVFVTPGQA
jgi:hypothetical protein